MEPYEQMEFARTKIDPRAGDDDLRGSDVVLLLAVLVMGILGLIVVGLIVGAFLGAVAGSFWYVFQLVIH